MQIINFFPKKIEESLSMRVSTYSEASTLKNKKSFENYRGTTEKILIVGSFGIKVLDGLRLIVLVID